MEKRVCFIGFDGFTDELLLAVKERKGPEEIVPYPTIASFGQKIVDAAGKSCNIELIIKQTKLGGNAPIMANALVELGYPVILAGTIGTDNQIEPLFKTLADRCQKAIPLGKSGYSQAIEFEDGKVILGKLDSLIHLTYEKIIEKIGREAFISYLDEADLFALTNWTMTPSMTEIWKKILSDIVPRISKKERWLFIDIADPAKRSDKDLQEALSVLRQFTGVYKVVFGLNQAEANRIAKTLMLTTEKPEEMAKGIREKLDIEQVVVHHKEFAIGADRKECVRQASFVTEHPVISTGAGDNFNAGYCNGLLLGGTMQEALLSGVGTSGFYVHYGKSPTIEELSLFIKK